MNKEDLQKEIKKQFNVDTGPRMSRTQLKEWIDSRNQVPQVGTYLPGEIRANDEYRVIKTQPILKRQTDDRLKFVNRNMSGFPPFTTSNGEVIDSEEEILEVYDDEDLDENGELIVDNNDDFSDLKLVVSNNDEEVTSSTNDAEETTSTNDAEETSSTNEEVGNNNDSPKVNNNDLGSDVEVFELAGYIDKVQNGAQRSKRINVNATFQPKDKPIQAPNIPKARARIVGLGRPSISGNQGIALQPTREAQQRTFEMSRPGHRVELSKPLKVSSKTEANDIDIRKLRNGTYTVDQLKTFLRELGLPLSGTKAVLTGRLQEVLA